MASGLKLGITTIEDLLLKNLITRDDSKNSIQNISLRIPNYQRPYKWTAKNVIQLLDDIIDAKNHKKEIYRVGTLILHQDEKDQVLYNIVDGQQRTITFSLLLHAMGMSEIPFLEQPLSNNYLNDRNIRANYRALERRIGNIEKSEHAELLNYIKSNCELIVVITKDISEAFQFFDSQNARGKKLYPHDLLKAYHLREMNHLKSPEIEEVVKVWEDLDQKQLSLLFSEYLYRLKEWSKGNKAWELNEKNIHLFKGLSKKDTYPFSQYFKGAYAYAEMINQSPLPAVTGTTNLKPFQLNSPIISGKPFFEYTKHYYEILKDVQDNSKYVGYFINDNIIVKTLDLRKYKNGVGNTITRLLFDTSILLYVDRFCPIHPSPDDLKMLDQFVVLSFIWAYSLRAQYTNLGWQSAQNYILGNEEVINSLNMYKTILESDSPTNLFSILSDKLSVLPTNIKANTENIDELNASGIYQNYLYFFKLNKFIEINE
jgi:hypothetical protein